MTYKTVLMGAAIFGLVSTAGNANAETLTSITAIDQGFYQSTGFHSPNNLNVYTGDNTFQGETTSVNTFFVFNISGLNTANSISVTFLSNGFFRTDTGQETINLFDVSTSIDKLVSGTGGLEAFSDLGSGAVLGEYTLSGLNNSRMPEFTVTLSSDFVSEFNSKIGLQDQRIAFGAALQTAVPGGDLEAFWSQSGQFLSARLNVSSSVSAVPEPATWAMFLLGFGAIGYSMRRRKGTTAQVSFA